MRKTIRRGAPTSAFLEAKMGYLFLGTTLIIAVGAVFL
jgi:hypothetical protein